MRIDLLARRWGGPDGGPDGMAVAASYLAWTLCALGHDVRGYYGAAQASEPWTHPRMEWRRRAPLMAPDDFTADLTITTISEAWRGCALAAQAAGASGRLVWWHHHGVETPEPHGAILAAPPSIAPRGDWRAAIVLPPSSWAAEAAGACVGAEVLVPGVGISKGGHVALAVARMRPDLRFYALPGRAAFSDVSPWRALGHVEVAPGHVRPVDFLARARVVLSPTRAEVHALALVEAATRGIPIVCSDIPGTRCALGESAVYVPMTAPPAWWSAALDRALAGPLPRLVLPPYAEVVTHALVALRGAA